MSLESCICVWNDLQRDLLAVAVKLVMVGVSLLHMTCVQTLPRCGRQGQLVAVRRAFSEFQKKNLQQK